ncbi:IS66-like element accessory protein TnpA [Variovorax paradoxus]|uniref:IS66-like element accessory protein TnpA n=1 Tax=Variovorax paradoxus TaxID=34073 RepID=UPI001ABC14B2
MTSEKTDTRRRYSVTTKAQVVAECAEPGASVAKIAMAHGINANVVHRWRKLARCGDAKAALKTGEFIALPLTMAPAPVPSTTSQPAVLDLQVELRRGAITMSITWPACAAAEFALWTREVLR